MIGRVKVIVQTCGSLRDVAAIEATVPSGPSGFHQRRYQRGGGSAYLLAWVNGGAVGHVLVTPESKYDEVRGALGRFPEAKALGVVEAYRRRGVARALMAAAADKAKQMGGDRLGLAVEADNERPCGYTSHWASSVTRRPSRWTCGAGRTTWASTTSSAIHAATGRGQPT